MERDPNISRLLRESGLETAPGPMTDRVMQLLEQEQPRPVKKYSPLIGRRMLWVIALLVVLVVVLSLVLGDTPAEAASWWSRLTLPEVALPEVALPTAEFDWDPKGWSISSGIVAAAVALFLLALGEARWGNRKGHLV
ncbi:MAG: hypothetical protein R2751_00645 [Bacteroidales bacterium]